MFQAQFGFYDTVVAVPSKTAALRAWGTRQDLFASGEARVTNDEAAIAAATAHPGTPLRRAIGSGEPFGLEPAGLPKLPDAPKSKPQKAQAAKPPAPARPQADRSKLDAAEKALKTLDERRKAEEAVFRKERADLEARISAAQNAYVAARKAATAQVVAARTEFRKAGGRG